MVTRIGGVMKVFLSWSGPTSKQIAVALRDWLPKVIQAIEPWMSSEDIRKGARWSSSLAKELETTKAGIVCVTSDNPDAPWLNFEAGALSKTVERQEMVCTFLFHLKPSQLTGPLKDFQATEATKEDTQKLIFTLNKATAKPIDDSKLQEAFEVWWGKFESLLSQISASTRLAPLESRSSEDMLAEVLGIVRDQGRQTDSILAALNATFTQLTLGNLRSNYINVAGVQGLYRPSESFGNVAEARPIQTMIWHDDDTMASKLAEPLSIDAFNPPGVEESGDGLPIDDIQSEEKK